MNLGISSPESERRSFNNTALPAHMPALDGLRGVAILMVILTHVSTGWSTAISVYQNTTELHDSFVLPAWLHKIASFGFLGVTLFFVVSAFTLTTRAAQSQGDLRAYALRRITRVGPGYWLAGIVYMLIGGLGPHLWLPDGISAVDIGIAAVFGTAWHAGGAFAVVPGGWSVSVEVAFYIALPFIIRIIDGQLWRAVVLAGFVTLLAEAWSVHVKLNHPWNFFDDCHPFVQAPSFLYGVTAALLAQRVRLMKAPIIALFCLCAAIFVLPLLHVPGLLPQIPFAVLVAITAALSAAHPPLLLASRFIRRIGEVSYSMYLVHFALLIVSFKIAEFCFPAEDWRTMLAHFLFTVVLSFAVACVTFKYIEQPPIKWMAKRLKARRTMSAQALNPPPLASR